jgi:hypothetical protein
MLPVRRQSRKRSISTLCVLSVSPPWFPWFPSPTKIADMFGGQALAGLVFGLYGFLVTFRSCEPRTRDTRDTRDTRHEMETCDDLFTISKVYLKPPGRWVED